MTVREPSVMPEHVHVSVEAPPSMSQSKALQLLKGNLSYQLFRSNEHFRLRYPQGHFFSPPVDWQTASKSFGALPVIARFACYRLVACSLISFARPLRFFFRMPPVLFAACQTLLRIFVSQHKFSFASCLCQLCKSTPTSPKAYFPRNTSFSLLETC